MAALVALLHILHMPAESGGAAVADCVESFSLVGTGHVTPLREELLFMRAENIGHFQPMFSHLSGAVRIKSMEPSVSSGLLVERTASSSKWVAKAWRRECG